MPLLLRGSSELSGRNRIIQFSAGEWKLNPYRHLMQCLKVVAGERAVRNEETRSSFASHSSIIGAQTQWCFSLMFSFRETACYVAGYVRMEGL